jgi:hypothetical protein
VLAQVKDTQRTGVQMALHLVKKAVVIAVVVNLMDGG